MDQHTILVIGATDGTGRCLVEQGLDRGYDVTAFARNPLAVTLRHDRLSIVRGDVFQKASVREAIAHQDAVLCAIGGHDRLRVALSGHPRSPRLCTIGTRNIVEAMRSLGVSPWAFRLRPRTYRQRCWSSTRQFRMLSGKLPIRSRCSC